MAMSAAQAELLEAAHALCAAFARHDRVPSAWPVARRFRGAVAGVEAATAIPLDQAGAHPPAPVGAEQCSGEPVPTVTD